MKEEKVKRKPRSKRTAVKKRLNLAHASLPAFNSWIVVSIECVLADVAKEVGVDKRLLRLLCVIDELTNTRGFSYVYELSALTGMDTRTVQRLLSEMKRIHLVHTLDRRCRVIGMKTTVTGWGITGYSQGIIKNIQSSWSGLTRDLILGNNIALQRIKAVN
jgi:hypothetical protein